MYNILNYLNSGLRIKLVLLVVAGIVSAFTVIGAFRVHVEKQQVIDEMRRSGQERVEMIAEAVTNLLVGYDYSNMESLTERIVQQQDVQHVIIRNSDGKVMVSRNKPGLPDLATLSFAAPVLFSGEKIGSVDLQLSLARMEAEINRTYRDVIVEQIFFGFFLGLLIYFAASSVIVKPIARISAHMKSIISSKDGAMLEELQMASHDEIGDLARIFNSLNRKVFDAQLRLREKIDLAGSALMKTNEQLQQRSQELEQRSLDLEKALSLVEKLAVTDSLTDLRNRRYFDDNLAAAFARAQRFNEPLCLILLDVDFFKRVNDTYGHAAGDTVLQTLARLFRSRTRETDISARLGGDEFSFLLYRTNREEGMLFAESLLKLAQDMDFTFHDQLVKIGLSIGLACNWNDIPSIEALYGAADEALYEAKRRGRNQVIAYPFDATPHKKLKSL
jgi:diguanylate cyclase (GGDEF)-like protein